ncbi:glycosyltransferase family 2 protein [Winogradskyella sp.]|uniref:glycosyltransferase family 2 protein n=1 Tax=Winogradskyella sp. TaxID=1883156 RepID=UPI0035C7BDAD
MHKPLVTILLPVYNGEKTIKTTLESLLNQTFENFEILIGIDGTTDKSKEIALNFNDNRIKIIEHPKNLGLANNLNKIMTQASEESQFFAMAEQDDIYVPERLEWQVEMMNKNPNVGLVSGIAQLVSETRRDLFPGILVYNSQFPKGKEMFKYTYINQLKVVNTCLLFRKSVHTNYELKFRNTYGNFNVDWDYILRFSLVSNIHGISKVLVKLNRNSTNLSVTLDRKKQHKMSRLLLNDFKKEYPQLITPKIYNKALKTHRKIEIGYKRKIEILFFSIYYFFIYFDLYFLNYCIKKLKEYFNKK